MSVQVYQDGWTAHNSRATWVEIDQDKLPLEVVIFVEAVKMGVRTTGPEGQFWYERGEVHTGTSAGGGAILYRLVIDEVGV